MTLILSPVEQFYNIIFHDIIRGTEFVLLLLNMALLFFLLSPLPFRFKTALLNRAAGTAKIRLYWPATYWSVISVLSLLLVDAMRQTWIYTQRVAIVQEAQLIGEQDNSVRYDMETHLLVAQRNFYLTGVTLFLFICNQRFCTMLMRMQGYERDIAELRKAQERTGNEKERAWLEAKEREKTAKAAASQVQARSADATSLEVDADEHRSLLEAQREAKEEVVESAASKSAATPVHWPEEARQRHSAAAAATVSAGGIAHYD